MKPDCPECGAELEAEEVDIGVGSQRVEPWHCPSCGWCEDTGPDDIDFVEESLPW